MQTFRSIILKILFVAGLSLPAMGCRTDFVAKDPIHLSPQADLIYQIYLAEDNPSYFAVPLDGSDGSYYYCPDVACRSTAMPKVVNRCEKKNPGKTCVIIDGNGKPLTEIQTWQTVLADQIEESKGSSTRIVANIHGTWPELAETLRGQATFFGDGKAGYLTFQSENPEISCDGAWAHAKGEPGNGVSESGFWKLSCDNNLKVIGRYNAFAVGEGKAFGYDTKARKLELTFTKQAEST